MASHTEVPVAAATSLGLARGLAVAVGSGLITSLAFFPLGVSWIVLVSLAPLVAVTAGEGPRRAALLGFAAGFAGFGCAFHWIVPLIMRFTQLPAPVALLAFLAWLVWESASWAAIGALWAAGRRTVAPGLVAVGALVVVEYLWPRIFLWHFGDPLVELSALAQVADLTGVAGASLLVAATNYAAGMSLRALCVRGPAPRWAIGGAACLLAGSLLYGAVRLSSEPPPHAPLSVGLVHAAIPLADKQRAVLDGVRQAANVGRMVGIARDGMAAAGRVDLVVMPEAMFVVAEGREGAGMAARVGAPTLFGASVVNVEPYRHYNGAILDDGARVQVYHKHRLLPFGEYFPLSDRFPQIERWIGLRSLSRGAGAKVLELGEHRLGPLVCYEAILPAYVRTFVRAGAQILVNVTEDGWYGWTGEPYQHLLVARFRAVENRRYLLRCVNNGLTAVVDPYGRIVAGKGDRHEPGFVRAQVGCISEATLYTLWGDWLVGVVAVAAAAAWWWSRRRA